MASTGDRFQAGDRVLCVPVQHFGFFERFRVSQSQAIPLDPRPPLEEALLAQPLGTVLFAFRRLPNVLGLDVVVYGQGPMGQVFNAVLRNLGARRIIAVDRLASRLEKSRPMGATDVIDSSAQQVVPAVKEILDGRLADLVVEVVGHRDQVFNDCLAVCRHEGRILFFGVPPTEIDGLRWRELFWKNITVHTSVGPDFGVDFPLAMQWIAEGRIDLRPVLTHRFPLAQIQQAFETFVDRKQGALKVLIDFPAGAAN